MPESKPSRAYEGSCATLHLAHDNHQVTATHRRKSLTETKRRVYHPEDKEYCTTIYMSYYHVQFVSQHIWKGKLVQSNLPMVNLFREFHEEYAGRLSVILISKC